MASKCLSPVFTHGPGRYAGGVGGNNGSRFQNSFNLFKNALFNVQPFHHHFNDPLGITEPCEIVFQISDGDQLGVFWYIKRCRF